jgi:hypothetical protein
MVLNKYRKVRTQILESCMKICYFTVFSAFPLVHFGSNSSPNSLKSIGDFLSSVAVNLCGYVDLITSDFISSRLA